MRDTTITINQDNCQHNLAVLKHHTNAHLLAMVKADAYGHGISPIATALTAADGFGVACLAEALELKKYLKDDPRPIVLIEGVFCFTEWQQTIDEQLMVVIHHKQQLDYAIRQTPPKGSPTATIWLKLNTGMNRLGFGEHAVIEAASCLIKLGYRLILTSHFACADDKEHPLNATQMAFFDHTLAQLKQRFGKHIGASLCNSAGFFQFGDHHHDWVRIGIALYGSSPLIKTTAHALNLKPVMSFFAKVIAIHHLKKGETVGYGALWVADKDTTVAIVSAGYGDGYPRVVSGAKVAIGKRCYPLVGRVAMDMMAVQVDDTVCIGDRVELWGETIGIDQVAHWADTISYELLCRVTQRPKRIIIPPVQKIQTPRLADNP